MEKIAIVRKLEKKNDENINTFIVIFTVLH